MTIKDDLHALVDELDEQDAREAMAYLRALRDLPSRPSPAFVEDTQRALDEALESDAVDLREWEKPWEVRPPNLCGLRQLREWQTLDTSAGRHRRAPRSGRGCGPGAAGGHLWVSSASAAS
jgi:hypothetical protein